MKQIPPLRINDDAIKYNFTNETIYVRTVCRRIGPMEADPAIITQLHNQLIPDLENSDDSGSDEEEDACAGWEAVSRVSFYIEIKRRRAT